ncbi:hypothetical protein AVEN_79579-1, partial [Araneus ventricosus]
TGVVCATLVSNRLDEEIESISSLQWEWFADPRVRFKDRAVLKDWE